MTILFTPTGNRSDLSATTSSSRVALPTSGFTSLRLTNSGSVTAYLKFGDNTVTASTSTGMDLLPGAVETIRLPPNCTHLAGITASGSTTVGVTPGEGA